MENEIKLTKDEIIYEVRRTGILHEHYFSAATVNLIYSYYDYEAFEDGYFLKEPQIVTIP